MAGFHLIANDRSIAVTDFYRLSAMERIISHTIIATVSHDLKTSLYSHVCNFFARFSLVSFMDSICVAFKLLKSQLTSLVILCFGLSTNDASFICSGYTVFYGGFL